MTYSKNPNSSDVRFFLPSFEARRFVSIGHKVTLKCFCNTIAPPHRRGDTVLPPSVSQNRARLIGPHITALHLQAEEVEREKTLVLAGKMPVKEASKELMEHPVFKMSQLTKSIIEEKERKVSGVE